MGNRSSVLRRTISHPTTAREAPQPTASTEAPSHTKQHPARELRRKKGPARRQTTHQQNGNSFNNRTESTHSDHDVGKKKNENNEQPKIRLKERENSKHELPIPTPTARQRKPHGQGYGALTEKRAKKKRKQHPWKTCLLSVFLQVRTER